MAGDFISGNGGGDTFAFDSGYSQLEISECDASSSTSNVLQLGSGITTSDVTLSADAAGDVIMTIGTSGDQITLDGEDWSNAYGVQSVEFSGGPTWTRNDLLVASGTATTDSDTLFGTASADTFDGLGGDDIEVGNGGGDTFDFNSGYGTLEINEVDTGLRQATRLLWVPVSRRPM